MITTTLTYCHQCGTTYAVDDGARMPCQHPPEQRGPVKLEHGHLGFVLPKPEKREAT